MIFSASYFWLYLKITCIKYGFRAASYKGTARSYEVMTPYLDVYYYVQTGIVDVRRRIKTLQGNRTLTR